MAPSERYYRDLPREREWHCWFCRGDITPGDPHGAGHQHFLDLSDPGAEWHGRWWHWRCFPQGPDRDRQRAMWRRQCCQDSLEFVFDCLACRRSWTSEDAGTHPRFRTPVFTLDPASPLYQLGHRHVHHDCLIHWEWREPIVLFLASIRYPGARVRETLALFRAMGELRRREHHRFPPLRDPLDRLCDAGDSEDGKNRRAA